MSCCLPPLVIPFGSEVEERGLSSPEGEPPTFGGTCAKRSQGQVEPFREANITHTSHITL